MKIFKRYKRSNEEIILPKDNLTVGDVEYSYEAKKQPESNNYRIIVTNNNTNKSFQIFVYRRYSSPASKDAFRGYVQRSIQLIPTDKQTSSRLIMEIEQKISQHKFTLKQKFKYGGDFFFKYFNLARTILRNKI